MTSGPKSEPSDNPKVPSYQDEDVKTGSEFPPIDVTTKSEDSEKSPSTTTGQTESVPSQDSNVSGFWAGSQPPPDTKSYTTSSTGDTHSLESQNSDVSGFWSSKGSGPASRTVKPTAQKGDVGDVDKPESGITTSSSGNTISNASDNSQVSGFWSTKSKSAGDAPNDNNNNQTSGTAAKAPKKGAQKAPDKQSQDSEFWAPTEDAAKGEDLTDYDTLENSSMSADKTMQAKT